MFKNYFCMLTALVSTAVLLMANISYGEKMCKIMPEELIEEAQKRGCEQVADFYNENPGFTDPPFVYGYFPGNPEDSAVFWCQKTAEGFGGYYLVTFYRGDKKKFFKGYRHNEYDCPDFLNTVNPPSGLSIEENYTWPLKDFYYVDSEFTKKGPEGVTGTHNAIRSYHDGVEEIFYCHEGKWLVKVRH